MIGGGIAAYKCLDLVRRGRERGHSFVCIASEAATRFVTPLSLAAISGAKVYTDLFSLTDEAEMGHIRLSRENDLLVVAPATADLLAKMAGGHADDLASTVLLATDKPVLVAPAMNPEMWSHAATRRNVEQLGRDGVAFVGPNPGDMACGETGSGRMAEPLEILEAVDAMARPAEGPLAGLHAVVTSGPTHEAIDPVRYIANRSSGRQGHAIAAALAEAGARVTLVTGPVDIGDPRKVRVEKVVSARDMLAAVEAALPADIAVCAAAVADWRPRSTGEQKLKKGDGAPPSIDMVENPDILREISAQRSVRPRLVIGFAAETENHLEHARAKLDRKGCDWIVLNDVGPDSGVFGGYRNRVSLIERDGSIEEWPELDKDEVARRLVSRVVERMAGPPH